MTAAHLDGIAFHKHIAASVGVVRHLLAVLQHMAGDKQGTQGLTTCSSEAASWMDLKIKAGRKHAGHGASPSQVAGRPVPVCCAQTST